MKVCPVSPDLMDDDWCYIIFEFVMNYSIDSFRTSYAKNKEDESKKVKADTLRKLGYSEEQIKKSHF